MKKYLWLLSALALCGAGCSEVVTGYRPVEPRAMDQARRVAILPFPGAGWYSDQFYYLASTELWPGRAVPKEEAAAAVRDAGLGGGAGALSRNQAAAVAAGLGADTVVTGYFGPQGSLRVRIVDAVSGAEWARARRVDTAEDLRVFVQEIKNAFNAAGGRIYKRRAAPGRAVPAKTRPSPSGGASAGGQQPQGGAGSSQPAPAAAGGAEVPAGTGTTAPREDETPSGGAGGLEEGGTAGGGL